MFLWVDVIVNMFSYRFFPSQLRKAEVAAEVAEASNYPDIRLMTVEQVQSNTPMSDLSGLLQPWTAANVPGK